jgi:hypothetical protein
MKTSFVVPMMLASFQRHLMYFHHTSEMNLTLKLKVSLPHNVVAEGARVFWGGTPWSMVKLGNEKMCCAFNFILKHRQTDSRRSAF